MHIYIGKYYNYKTEIKYYVGNELYGLEKMRDRSVCQLTKGNVRDIGPSLVSRLTMLRNQHSCINGGSPSYNFT